MTHAVWTHAAAAASREVCPRGWTSHPRLHDVTGLFIFTGARWRHTECAELINGLDDAFALLCACAAAPFPIQGDIQQLLLFFLYQWDAQPQLVGERGCAEGKNGKNPSNCKEVTFGRKCSLNTGSLRCGCIAYHHQEWAPYPKDSSSLCLRYPSWMRNSGNMLISSTPSHLWALFVMSFACGTGDLK